MSMFSWGGSSKKLTSPADANATTLASPITKIVLLPTDGSAFPPPRKIIGDKAGTATVKDFTGGAAPNFPITSVEQNLALTAISALSTTSEVWGLY